MNAILLTGQVKSGIHKEDEHYFTDGQYEKWFSLRKIYTLTLNPSQLLMAVEKSLK